MLTLRNILLTTIIIPINSNRTVFNSTLHYFSQWIKLSLDLTSPSFLCTATLNKIHVTNMSKLTNKNTNETAKNLTPSSLQLTLNTCNTSIHCSIKSYVATTQIKVSEYLKRIEKFKSNNLLIHGIGIRLKWRRDTASFFLLAIILCAYTIRQNLYLKKNLVPP